MSTLTQPAERIAAAGCSRAPSSDDIASFVRDRYGASEHVGSATSTIATFRGWGSNPTQGMQVKATTKRHDLTPAPRPEEASP